MAETIPVSIELRESAPNRLTAHSALPMHCPDHGDALAAVLSIEVISAYSCSSSKMETTATLAQAAHLLADDGAFWVAVKPFVERAWKRAQGDGR